MTSGTRWELIVPAAESVESDVAVEMSSLAGLFREIFSVSLIRGQVVTISTKAESGTIFSWTLDSVSATYSDQFVDWLDQSAEKASPDPDDRGLCERSVAYYVAVDQTNVGTVRFHIPDIAKFSAASTLVVDIDSGAQDLSSEEYAALYERVFTYAVQKWHNDRQYISLSTEQQQLLQHSDDAIWRYQDLLVELLPIPLNMPDPATFAVGVWLYFLCSAEEFDVISRIANASVRRPDIQRPDCAVLSVPDDADDETYYAVLRALGYATFPEIEAELSRAQH